MALINPLRPRSPLPGLQDAAKQAATMRQEPAQPPPPQLPQPPQQADTTTESQRPDVSPARQMTQSFGGRSSGVGAPMSVFGGNSPTANTVLTAPQTVVGDHVAPIWDAQTANFNTIWKKHESELPDLLASAEANRSRELRRASELSAMGGQGLGGAFGASAALAQNQANEFERDTRMEHNKRGLELQMTNLLQQLKMAEAAKDRDLTERLQQMVNDTQLQLQELANKGDLAEIGSAAKAAEAEARKADDGGPFGHDYVSTKNWNHIKDWSIW